MIFADPNHNNIIYIGRICDAAWKEHKLIVIWYIHTLHTTGNEADLLQVCVKDCAFSMLKIVSFLVKHI